MKLFSLLILSVMSVNAFAYDCEKAPAKIRGAQLDTCLKARGNVAVDDFLLTKSGDLYAYIKKIDRVCQVTTNVTDMKGSAHPQDAATLYFVKSGDLYVANDIRATGNCPTMTKKMIMPNVDKYNVVSNTNTTIVNVALDTSGKFVAWENSKVVYSDILVKDYLMNTNFGASGKAFSSYVVFTQDIGGYITKVKGEGTGKNGMLISSKSTDKSYKTIQAFKKDVNLN